MGGASRDSTGFGALEEGLPLCDPMDCKATVSSVQGIFQAILEWVAISFSKESSQSRDQILVFCVSGTGRQILYH